MRPAVALLAAALAAQPRALAPGPSLEGGRCEFLEFWLSSSVSCST